MRPQPRLRTLTPFWMMQPLPRQRQPRPPPLILSPSKDPPSVAAGPVAVSTGGKLQAPDPAPQTPGSGSDDQVQFTPEKPTLTYPTLSTHLNRLADGYSSGQMSQEQAAGEAPVHSGGSVAVTVYLDSHVSDVVTFLKDNGGDVRNVGSDYIEAYVPVGLLGPLSQQSGVTRVWEIIPPQPTYGNVTSQEVGLHLADSWQGSGYRGQGVKVGVIDVGFRGYSSLMGVELPANVEVRCYTDIGVFSTNLADCERSVPVADFNQCPGGSSGSVHGTAVAEAVVDIAPDVTLYIADPHSPGDLQEIVDWMAGEGVSVANMSLGWIFDGPGDGTSPFSNSPLNAVDRAVSRGITWVNSAGNSAEDTWFGSYSDNDGDGAINFNNSGAEINSIALLECEVYTFQLRWEDSWGGADTDLDIYLWDQSANALLDIPDGYGYVGSIVEQSGASNHIPFERFSLLSPIDSSDVGVVIVHESGPVPQWVQLTLWGPGGLRYATGSGSITNPAESANPGLLAVGAVPFYDINTIEPFSSQGPTPDGRTKPDIAGVDCAASVTYEHYIRRDNGRGCWFAGTSQASPHVAGLAALVRLRFPDFTAQQTATYLKNNAQARGGVPNNTWGYGFAKLPATDVGGCVYELTTDGANSGQWSPHCQSLAPERGYSQYYTFTLEETTQVTIDLESSVDPYLFLRRGEARSGDFLYQNDDIEAGANTNSRITATLAAGTYTIEATTYGVGEVGNFTLTMSGLGGDGTGEGGTTPDGCGENITTDGTTPGTWASACESQVPDRGYARYYTFTLAQQSAVTIDLESTVDTYLYLRSGNVRTGPFLYENDDVEPGSDTDSQISQTLTAGTYTIEATTYATDQAGSFTLTLRGLSGTTTDPDPDPETETCSAIAITADGTTSGTWASNCESQVSDRGYARYYTFTLEQQSAVTITLESDLDTYLYLREGEARSGTPLHYNDDIESGGVNLNSRISETLAAGAYTIEATTYAADQVGTFTLTINGLSGTTTDPDPDPDPETETCSAIAITADGTTSGTWGDDCQSMVTGRGYARYYTFTLAQESAVTITLESEEDTFLLLWSGEARSGTPLHYNDDIEGGGVNLNSRISETLAAGAYTIEATTYAADQAGTFTLTISGLSGVTTDPDPDPDPETDACSATAITADGTTSGIWADDCQSMVSDRGYARYYTFTLAQESAVTITLESEEDTFLLLWSGEARSGTPRHFNDDIESGGVNLNSRISETLAAGAYTIEATTYAEDQAGTFTLTINGLSGTTTDPDPDPETDACSATAITADGTTSGTWGDDCQSMVTGRGYARYYTFTLNQESAVTITLESEEDTFLLLWSGEARSGIPLHFNDDIESGGVNLNSRISQTLAAGAYTIEATTYKEDRTGTFTLTVTGLD